MAAAAFNKAALSICAGIFNSQSTARTIASRSNMPNPIDSHIDFENKAKNEVFLINSCSLHGKFQKISISNQGVPASYVPCGRIDMTQIPNSSTQDNAAIWRSLTLFGSRCRRLAKEIMRSWSAASQASASCRNGPYTPSRVSNASVMESGN